MKKIAFVVQRYGLEVNGGAELLCRQFAEKLSEDFEVEVLTTCAKDYYSWRNEYPESLEEINGVKVRRFKADFERNMEEFNKLLGRIFADKENLSLGEQWMKAQGPYSSGLINFVQEEQDKYDNFVFFTYLYATTYFCMPLIRDKKKIFFVPTAHDELPIYIKIFNKIFNLPHGIIFLTEEEKRFVNSYFNINPKSIIAGAGVEFPNNYENNSELFKRKHKLSNYLIYVGRIDEPKGCKELFKYFLEYKKQDKSDLKLVLMGKEEISVPKSEDIISLGFVSDFDKFDGICGADVMLIPSPSESLSIVLLESFLCKTPVLVNENTEVLKAHCVKSNGGLFYSNKAEFTEAIKYLENNKDIRTQLGQNGFAYVKEHYQWDKILERIKEFLNMSS